MNAPILSLMVCSSILIAMEQSNNGKPDAYDLLVRRQQHDMQCEVGSYLHVPPKIIHKIASKMVQKSEFAFEANPHQGVPYCGIGMGENDHFFKGTMVMGMNQTRENSVIWDEYAGTIVDFKKSFSVLGELLHILTIGHADYRGEGGNFLGPKNCIFGYVNKFQGSSKGPYADFFCADAKQIVLHDRQRERRAVINLGSYTIDDAHKNVEFCNKDGKDYIIIMMKIMMKKSVPIISSMGSDTGYMQTLPCLIDVVSFRDMQGNELFRIIPQGSDEFKHFMCYEDDHKDIKLIINTINFPYCIKRWNLSEGLKVRLAWQKGIEPYQILFLRLLWPYMVITRNHNGTRYHPKLVLNIKDHQLAIKTLRSFDYRIQELLMEYVVIDESWYEWAKNWIMEYVE